jgi:cellulose synthase/poly-beta-1,6-N-acetylglucosamine synthase-like glycosyltransferase
MRDIVWLQILFWLAIAWVAYALVGYQILLFVASRLPRAAASRLVRADITPAVSLLIAARNEETVIAEKLENTLALDYPRDRLQVIVMSDASTDRTDEIVRGYADQGIELHAVADGVPYGVPCGLGKPNAMNATVPLATGEIILISDANSMYGTDALRKMTRNFADPRVGCVTGEERRVATAEGAGLGESLYCRLDNWIKRLEGQVGSMVMVNGGFVAIRRELYPKLDPRLNFDLVWAPLLQLQGYRTVYEPEAVSVETYPLDSAGDFRRRTRTVMQAFYSYLAVPQALNPLRTGWYAVRLLSHRFARWFVAPALAVALVANAGLAGAGPVYRILFIVQVACYAAALAGWLLDRAGQRFLPFYVPYYFVYVHTAAFAGVCKALAGRRVSSWTPTERTVGAG